MKNFIWKLGQVESIDDEAEGLRIKARIAQDKSTPLEELPYCFPLLPKTIQSVPKVGECVLVTTSDSQNLFSDRFYLGPLISQKQNNYNDQYEYGRGSASSLLSSGSLSPLPRISNYDVTRGAFPNVNDIAVVGRKSEDVVLKDDEIDIRCGIREDASLMGVDGLQGFVSFNDKDPVYIQLKHSPNIGHSDESLEANGVINLVADKINFISHKDKEIDRTIVDKDELIKSSDMDAIMQQLHQLPYGDLLVEYLKKLTNMILNHVHPYPGMPPCPGTLDYSSITTYNLDDLLSDNVRIS